MEEDIIEEQLADDGPEPMRYVPTPQEARAGYLRDAAYSFGQSGASSSEEVIERAEAFRAYTENGVQS